MQGLPNAARQRESLSLVPSGIRVVILEPDKQAQVRLRGAIDENPLLSLVAAVSTWSDCEGQLQELIPELLIAMPGLVPPQAMAQLLHSTFPVVVWLGSGESVPAGLALFEVDEVSVRSALSQACAEIFRRKACELSSLLERYLSATRDISDHVTSLKLRDDNGIAEIAVEEIILLSASGNYIRVHTAERTYEFRETLTGITGKLSKACFVRVHRSHIVNLSCIRELIRQEGEFHLILNTGKSVPVGPNYREEISNILAQKTRLVA